MKPSHRSAAFLLALGALLAGCEGEPIPEAADPAVARGGVVAGGPTAPPDGVADDLPTDSIWTAVVTGAGAAIVLSAPDGSELLRISCARDPAVMTIDAHTLAPIGSEERLSLGVDDEPFVFVADVRAPAPIGLHAEGPIDPDLLRRLAVARRLSASYGAQLLGPFDAPGRETLVDFTNACRRASENG